MNANSVMGYTLCQKSSVRGGATGQVAEMVKEQNSIEAFKFSFQNHGFRVWSMGLRETWLFNAARQSTDDEVCDDQKKREIPMG